MTRNELLVELQDIFQKDDAIAQTDILADLPEWDSLSKMSVMAYYKKHFNIEITLSQLGELVTVSDLINIVGAKLQ